MLTASNVSDVKAAPALLERAGRMRYLLADKAAMPTGCVVRYVTPEPPPSFPDGETANVPSATTRTGIAAAT